MRFSMTRGGFFVGAVALLTGCGGASVDPPNTGSGALPSFVGSQSDAQRRGSTIEHVVIIVQENRSVDNLFHGLPGADTADSGQNSKGQAVQLKRAPLTAPFDMSHTHGSFEIEHAKGRLDGFNDAHSKCMAHNVDVCPAPNVRAYSYVPRSDVQPYFAMAERFTFADRMFQTNEGPSFPAHQYLISGTSTESNSSRLRAAENPGGIGGPKGGCDSAPGTLVKLIDPDGNENQSIFPCFDRISLMSVIDEQSLTWHYYQAKLGPGLWNAPAAVSPIYNSSKFSTDVVAPSAQILRDVAAGRLSNVVWVTPDARESDHAGVTDGSGPSWVASVVNAIGESPYWSSTVILVTWDDWGGWYDHVKPKARNSYELGFRVPLIVISPYAKRGYVSHVDYEFGSILKFTESVFGLRSLATTDANANDLSDCFNYGQSPARFTPIVAPLRASYFLTRPPSPQVPDDDY